MNTRIAASLLAVLGGAMALLAPTESLAGNVGVYGSCTGGSKTQAITQAGHTPVAIGDLNAESLSGLTALIIETCYGYTPDPDVTAAVAGGLYLIVNDWNWNNQAVVQLPGGSISQVYGGGDSINLASGSPIATGPGGILTDTSLDGGHSSWHSYFTAVPAGATALLTSDVSPEQVVSILYPSGSGRVAYNAIPVDHYLMPGGHPAIAPGILTFMTNLLACGLDAECAPPPPSATCESEGYTGTKLLWCQNICEKGYTGATLQTWIHRWIRQFRDLPYCAAEGGPEGPGQN